MKKRLIPFTVLISAAAALAATTGAVIASGPPAPMTIVPLVHVRYVPEAMITNASKREEIDKLLATWARPGDTISYRLEPKSRNKFTDAPISYDGDKGKHFDAPQRSTVGVINVKVKSGTAGTAAKATLHVRTADGTVVDLDPLIIIEDFY